MRERKERIMKLNQKFDQILSIFNIIFSSKNIWFQKSWDDQNKNLKSKEDFLLFIKLDIDFMKQVEKKITKFPMKFEFLKWMHWTEWNNNETLDLKVDAMLKMYSYIHL
jgi:hypothetical protein